MTAQEYRDLLANPTEREPKAKDVCPCGGRSFLLASRPPEFTRTVTCITCGKEQGHE